MPPALILLLLAAVIPGHKDWAKIPKQCESCHVGHGVSGMKLAPIPEPDLCLRCHGGAAQAGEMVKKGYMSPSAKPQDVSREMGMPYTHNGLRSCSVCHAGHGIAPTGYVPGRQPKPGTRRSDQLEHELCGACHAENPLYQSPVSFHGVITLPKTGSYPSLKAGGMGAQTWVNCSDCHGVSDVSLPQGVHGSDNAALLKYNDQVLDGQAESASAYAQCYACHDRNSILQNESFVLHQAHIVNGMTSCYTCHDSHAGRTLPHLLALTDESRNDRISPDQYGRKSYAQTGDRAGICYLTCHNVAHDGWTYGPSSAQRQKGTSRMMPMPKPQTLPGGNPVRK